ncbi:MAG: 2-oxoglutarate dehydrogenase complex dihydrolipoyllysine-residue succinyltransferase [Kiloniellales bacterium]|nr:2-oxoglutarate dehydrogenase complex dihydrolipoyllysine-residue succinyltransferase [Kiloniellales bacterium]
MTSDILVPTLGESVSEATVAQWLKKPGEAVALDEPVVELETDKVTLEVNAAEAGVLSEIVVEAGANVEVGALLGRIAEGEGAAPAAVEAKPEAPAPAAPAANGGGAPSEVVVPALGESVSEGTVGQWMKQVGEVVAADEPLVELETDKVTLEVNAPVSGVLSEIKVQEGATVEVGAVLAIVTGGGAPAAPAPVEVGPAHGELSPAVRKMLAEHDLDPAQVPGTGKGGRITTEDVVDYLEKGAAAAAPAPAAPSPAGFAPGAVPRSGPGGKITKADLQGVLGAAAPAAKAPSPGGVTARATPAGPREERVRMTKLRQTIARRLKEAQTTAAMLTTFNEVDMGAVMALRAKHKEGFEKKHGVKLGFMSFFAKAVVAALKEFPSVNARIDGEEIVYNKFYDIGMAVSTPNGLMVPILRDCDVKSFAEIEAALGEVAARARDGKIGMDELQGGSFTITNGGVFGSLNSTPILNMPQSAILGLHKIQERPMAVKGEVVIRPMMYLALSYDHRIIDGREAVTFLVRVKECIEDPERMLVGL